MDLRQSSAFRKYLEYCGWNLQRLKDGSFIFFYKITLIGTVLRIPRVEKINLWEISKIIKKYEPIFVKIEPIDPNKKLVKKLKSQGFRQDLWSIEPTKTLIIDLNLKKDQIFSAFKPKWRQNIRFAAKNGVSVKHEDDITTFINIWQQNAKNKGRLIEKPEQTRVFWEEFKKQNKAFILTAFFKGETIASALLIFWKETCHLWHLGYTGKHPQLKSLYLLVWESILFAKSKGMKNFDFEGIEDPRYSYSKKTHASYFKKGFGGKEKEYPGSFIKFYNPTASLIYQIVSRINPGLFRLFFKSKPVSY